MSPEADCNGCHRPAGDLHEHHCRHFNPELGWCGRRLLARPGANRVEPEHTRNRKALSS